MKKRSVVTNYLYNLAYQVTVVLVPLVTTPYVSRVLGPEGVGVYSYSLSVSTLCSLFVALGINMYGQRAVASVKSKREQSQIFFELEIIRILAGLATLIVYIFICNADKYSTALYLQTFVLLAALFDISWFFQGQEDFKPVAVRNIFIKILASISVFMLVRKSEDVYVYIVICSISTFLGNVLLLLNLKGCIEKIRIHDLCPQRHIGGTLQFFIPIVAVQLYSQIDKVMLGVLLPDAIESGYFEQARKISSLLTTLCISINDVSYPHIASLMASSQVERIKNSYIQSIRVVWMVTLPAVIGLILVAPNFSAWFYGPGYGKVSVLLQIAAPMVLFSVIGNYCSMQYLNPSGNQNKATVAYIIASILNVALNLYLIPQLLSIGAMVASLCAEMTSCAIQLFLFLTSRYKINIFKYIKKYLIASLAMAATILSVSQIPCSSIYLTLIQLLSGVISYGIMLLVLKEKVSSALIRKICAIIYSKDTE